jgi:hypothetical protein
MVICDRPDVLGSRLAATQVRDLLLDLAGASAATSAVSTVS